MKKIVAIVVVIILTVASFAVGAQLGGYLCTKKVCNMIRESLCSMDMNEIMRTEIWNDDETTCLGEFIIERIY